MEYALKEDKCHWKAVRILKFRRNVWSSGRNKKERKKEHGIDWFHDMLVELLSINNHSLLAFFVQTYQDMRCVDVSGIQGMVLRRICWSMTMKYTFKLSQWRNLLAKGSVSFNSKFFLNTMEESFQKVFKISSIVSGKLEKSNKIHHKITT